MTVYIVLRNGAVDEVFSDPVAAENHRLNLIHRWNSAQVIEREVRLL